MAKPDPLTGDLDLATLINEKMKEIQAVTGADPWVTRTPEEAAQYIAGYARGVEDAAKSDSEFICRRCGIRQDAAAAEADF